MSILVSLVIPVQDEEGTVSALLESVEGQTRLPDEVVVVDAGSRDRTLSRLKDSRLAKAGVLRAVAAGRVYPGVARNIGAAAATHQWLAFSDAGIVLSSVWLEALIGAIDDERVDAVFGSFEPVCDRFSRRCAAIAYVPAIGSGGIRGPSAASMILKRSLFENLGGFPPFRAAEDLIFLERLSARAEAIRLAPTAIVYWSTPRTVLGTFRRFALYSFHNLAAGRGRHWHRGVAILYLKLVVCIAVASAAGAGPWSLALPPAFFLARAVKAAWLKRRSLPFPLGPIHVVGAAALLVVIDVATIAGALRWWGSGQLPQR